MTDDIPDRVRHQIESEAKIVAHMDAEQNARIVERVRNLAYKWDNTKQLSDGSSSIVAKAFAAELFIALAVHKSDGGDVS